MEVRHKRGLQTYYLYIPNYIKYNSIYGYLVGMNGKVFFIYNTTDELFSDDITEDFDIL